MAPLVGGSLFGLVMFLFLAHFFFGESFMVNFQQRRLSLIEVFVYLVVVGCALMTLTVFMIFFLEFS